MSQKIREFLDFNIDNLFKDVPNKPLSFWGSVKEGMKVPFIEPSLFNAIAFEQDPSVNTAELLLNTADIISAGDPNYVRYSWKDVQQKPTRFWDWFKQTLGTSLGYQFSPIVGATVLGPAGYATLATSQYFIDNMKTRAAEYMRKVDEEGMPPPETPEEFTNTLKASVGQMGLDMLGFSLFGLQRLVGFGGRNQAKQIADKIVKEKSLVQQSVDIGAKGVAIGAGIEVPTEVAQTVLERWQARLPLTGDDAYEQYLEAAMGGFFLGTSLGTSMQVLNKFNNNVISEQSSPVVDDDITSKFEADKIQAQPPTDPTTDPTTEQVTPQPETELEKRLKRFEDEAFKEAKQKAGDLVGILNEAGEKLREAKVKANAASTKEEKNRLDAVVKDLQKEFDEAYKNFLGEPVKNIAKTSDKNLKDKIADFEKELAKFQNDITKSDKQFKDQYSKFKTDVDKIGKEFKGSLPSVATGEVLGVTKDSFEGNLGKIVSQSGGTKSSAVGTRRTADGDLEVVTETDTLKGVQEDYNTSLRQIKKELGTYTEFDRLTDAVEQEETKRLKAIAEQMEREANKAKIVTKGEIIEDETRQRRELENLEQVKKNTKDREIEAALRRLRILEEEEKPDRIEELLKRIKDPKQRAALERGLKEDGKSDKDIGLEREKKRLDYIRSSSFGETDLGMMANDLTSRLKKSASTIDAIERQINELYGKAGSPVSIALMKQVNGLLNSGKLNASNFLASTRPAYNTDQSLPIIQMFSAENRRKALAESKAGRPQLLSLQNELNDYIQNWQLHKDILNLTTKDKKLIGTGPEILDRNDSGYALTDYFGSTSKRSKETDQGLFRPITDDAVAAIRTNNIEEAFDAIGRQNPELKKIADKLKKFNTNTGIRYAEVRDTFNQRKAGYYDTGTNVITIDPEYGGSPHTLLHEATHAATHALLKKDANPKNPKHFLVKQIREIFEESKEFIDPDLYQGAFRFNEKENAVFDLEEFVAEFFSNPEFQQALSEIRYKNSKQTLIDRMVNFIRRLFNYPRLPERGVDKLNDLIGKILQTSETHPVQKNLFSAAIQDGKQGVMDMTFGRLGESIKNQPKLTEENVSLVSRILDALPGGSLFRQFQPIAFLVDDVKRVAPDYVHKQFKDVYDTIRRKGGYFQEAQKKHDFVVKKMTELQAKDPETFKEFGKLATKTTEYQVIVADKKGNPLDPNNPTHADLMEKDKAVKKADKLYDENITNKLRKEYKKYGEPYHRLYAAMLKMYETEYDSFIKTVGEQLDNFTNIDPKTLGFIKGVLNKGMENTKRITPYLSLSRFGDYKVSILQIDKSPNPVDGKGYMRRVEHFESARERDIFIAQFREDTLNKIPVEKRQAIIDLTNKFKEYGKRGIAVNPAKDLKEDTLATFTEDKKRAYLDLKRDFENLDRNSQFLYTVYNSPTSFNSFYDLAKDQDLLGSLPSKNVLKELERILNDAKASDETKKEFYNFAFASLPDVLLGDIVRKRSNPVILGASPDIIKSYTSSMVNMIAKGANIKFNRELDSQMNTLRETIRRDAMSGEAVNYKGGTVESVQGIMKVFSEKIDFVKNPTDNAFISAATAGTYHWFLGANISSALIQTTNIPLVIYPLLGGNYGYGKASSAIMKAAKILTNAGFTRTVDDPTGLLGDETTIDSVSILNYSEEQLEEISKSQGYEKDDLLKFRNALKEFGQIGKSNEREYLNIGKVGGEVNNGRRFLNKLLKGSSFLFNTTEQFNREVSALATFDLEYKKGLENGLSREEAYKNAERKGVDAVEELNGGISRETTANINNKNFAMRLLLLFKNYGFALYSVVFKLLGIIKDDKVSKEEAQAAAKALAGMIGASAILGGVKGLPFFFVPEVVYNSFFRDEGEEDLAALTERLFGVAPIDRITRTRISGRTSFNEVIFQTPRIEDETLRGTLDAWTLAFFGPAYSLGRNLFAGGDDIIKGNYQAGVEKMLPTSLSNALKGFRYYTEGSINKRGDMIMEPMGLVSAFSAGVGLKPLSVYVSTDVPYNVNKRIREIDNKKQGYLEKLEKASKLGDVDTFRKVRKELLEYADKEITTPVGRIKIGEYFNITPSSISKSLKIRLSRDKPYGMYVNPRYKDLYTNIVEKQFNDRGIEFAEGMVED